MSLEEPCVLACPDIAFGCASHCLHFVIAFHFLRSSLCAGHCVVKAMGGLYVGCMWGTGWEGMREMGDSCCSQLQVCGHLSLNGAVRRGLIAFFGNSSPDTPHVRKHPSPYSLCSSTQCCLCLPFAPHLPLMQLGFNTRRFRHSPLFF